ncbi:MAG: ABC transporter permease, partial [Tannerellaceae bacterium]
FLYYESVSQAVANCALAMGDKIKVKKIGSIDAPKESQLAQVQGINVVGTAVFNHTEGYGDYLVPQVMLLVLYQTLVIGIGILAGTQREKNKGELLSRKATSKRGVMRIVLGKSICYLIVYGIISLFIIGFIPFLFDLPNRASGLNIVAFMIPFLLATTFIGICLSVFFHSEESPLLLIVFSSVPLLFLAGTSYPFELLPWYWRIFHYIIPAPLATMAFVKLNSMGAEFSQIKMEYITLWIQTFVYFVLALFAYSHNIKQIKKANTMKATNSQKTNT